MVVASLIGILAALGTTQYQKFAAKARQTEAKIELAAIYTFEIGYSGENGTYTSCLYNFGYAPSGVTVSDSVFQFPGFYEHGFTPAGAAACPGPTVVVDGNVTGTVQNYGMNFLPTKSATGIVPSNWGIGECGSGGCTPTTGSAYVVTVNQFTAGASGKISSTASVTDDWQITEQKAITNTQSGL
jgi:type IV pilus assembly protein PilA